MGGFSDPDQPIFAPAVRQRARPSRGWMLLLLALLACGCCGVTAVFSVKVVLDSVGQALTDCMSSCLVGAVTSGTTSGGGSGVPAGAGSGSANQPKPASEFGAALGRVLREPLSTAMVEAIEISWGIDSVAANARRLESITQSLREYEHVHGHPPERLEQLNLLSGDLQDVFGNRIEYRVVGQPPRWQIRSAGRDRRFDDLDPWVPER